jgi:DNA end-binding protein Ku
MASTVWKGYISFGLVSVPVRLYAAARESHVSFNQIHTPCGSRIKQQLVCPRCDRPVERQELSKGYEVEKDTFVTITGEELKSLESASSDVMSIQQFVSLNDIDPIYFQTSYYSVAEDPGRRAYTLLFRSMEQLNLAAIAKVSMHGREQVVLIRPYDKGLVLHTLYYSEEVREVSEYGSDTQGEVQPQEVALAEQFMQQLTSDFDPEQYQDTYRDKVMELIESKRQGAALPEQQAHRRLAPVIDLMDALKKSLAAQAPASAAAPPAPVAAPVAVATAEVAETASRKKPPQAAKARAAAKPKPQKEKAS